MNLHTPELGPSKSFSLLSMQPECWLTRDIGKVLYLNSCVRISDKIKIGRGTGCKCHSRISVVISYFWRNVKHVLHSFLSFFVVAFPSRFWTIQNHHDIFLFTSGYVNTETILHFSNEARSRNCIWLDKFTNYVIIWFNKNQHYGSNTVLQQNVNFHSHTAFCKQPAITHISIFQLGKQKSTLHKTENVPNYFWKASPRQERQTITCLSVTFNLKAQTRSVYRKRKISFLVLPLWISLV